MFLSRSDKVKGQKSYLTYTFINGLGYSFLAETIIYLMALHFGADNTQLGYISSTVYLTGLVVFFVPRYFPGVRIVNLFFGAWLLRGLVCLAYGGVFYLPQRYAVYLIIGVYTLYCLLRNVAYPLNHVLQGIVTKPSERGNYSSKVMVVLYASMMLSRFISFTGLSIYESNELKGIYFLLGLGIILNTAASIAVKRIPVKDTIQRSNLGESFQKFLGYLKDSRHRILILLYCGGMSLIVLFNFTVPFLRKSVGIPSNIIFIFTTINFLGVIISSRLARPFLDRFGSKPLLTIVNLIIIVLSLIWVMLPGSTDLWIFFLLGFISLFFIGMIRLLLDRLIVNSIPEDDRVGFSSAVAVVFSLVSLGVGLLGGYLADFSSALHLAIPHEYSLSFGLMGLLALFNFALSLLLQERGSLSANQFLNILINPKHLKTIHNIDLLKRTQNQVRRQSLLAELESDQSHLATQEIQKRLKLATLRDKEMVIRSLFSNPRPELEEDIIEEAMDNYSWWRQSAIFALGAYNSPKSKQALRQIMEESYPYIKSIAAKSMARIHDYSCHQEILDLVYTPKLDVRTYINLVIALSIIEREGGYWKIIFDLIPRNNSFRFKQSLFIIGSTRNNFQPPLESLFHELNLSEQGGFDTLFEEIADMSLSEEEFTRLFRLSKQKDYLGLWDWCRKRCTALTLLEPFESLRLNILGFKGNSISPTLALAGLYFTMHLDKNNQQH
ncbi:MFS transporter [Spirochaeta cellobiosiphila]|uniref:MFS transporter n=1 Tax=Spirochaeta cellobiosiphila TaxID=504483 RepID=UPI001469A3E3|nr:MFS transporter [Spirochaeta cellobiosiphila]